MRLWEGLQVHQGDVISLVGAGGKTTTMYRLGRELAQLGWRVVATTTTKIRPPSPEETEDVIVADEAEDMVLRVREALGPGQVVTVVAERLEDEGKLKGIPPYLAASLRQLADAVIIEADGAKGLSLKAPAADEPVVPVATSIVVPVVGVDAVGCALTGRFVHRHELVAGITGLAPGELITVSTVASVLLHEQGALKGVPLQARVVPFVNKVHDEATLSTARQIARRVKSHPSLDRVLIGAAAAADPVLECWRRVSAVVLAAGGSTRFGRPKLLLPVAGKTMLEHVLAKVQATSVHEVVVVLGNAVEQLVGRVPEGCRWVCNERWQTGISSSIRVGLEAIDRGAEAALFVLADQPGITTAMVEQILQAYYGATKAIVAPVYQRQRGTPVLFDRRLFPKLAALHGDVGGRELLARCPEEVLPVEMSSAEVFLDVDVPADYERLDNGRAAMP